MPNDDNKLPPPSGDTQRAEGYVNQLIPFISGDKLKVTHTDLSKFDPSSLHDHYSLDLRDYQVEISHTKQPTTGRDSYVILFNNLKNLADGQSEKEILAYLIISEEQFKRIKDVADEQIETLKKIDEEKRFKAAMTPVDELFDKIAKGEIDLSQEAQPIPNLPSEKPNEIKTDEHTEANPDDEHAEAKEPMPVEPTPPAETPSHEQSLPEEKPPAPISALAAAASIPVVEELPSTPPAIASATPTPQPEVNPPAPLSNQPLPAPTATIEEVQKALQKAYAQSPQQQPPPEYRPNLGQAAPEMANPLPPIFSSTINTIPAENSLPANPPLDQAINQAFKPADNSILSQAVQTPEV